jgi:hypothetical protein
MKNKVYGRKVDTGDAPLDHMMDVIARINERQDKLRQATCHVLAPVAKSVEVEDGIFENMLH